MSSDEQTPAVAEVENAKKSDGPSTANEHSVDKVNDDEEVPQVDEKSTTDKEPEAASATTEVDTINGKLNNKRDINHLDDDDEEKKNGHGHGDDEDEEAVVSTTTTNKKIKILDPLVNENSEDIDESSSASAKVPNEELTVV